MALRTTEDPDTKLNPGQADYDQKFNGIAAAEEAGTFDDIADNYDKTADDSQENSNIAKAREAEENPSADYKNNVTGKNNPIKAKGKLNFLKKKGPMGAILGVLVGGIGLSSLLSPGILLVQMKEVMVDKFNTQLASMDVRTTKLISAKIDNTTGGICTGAISIRCKYSSMSEPQVARFKNAGIEVISEKTGITGRVKPTEFKFENKSISAANFSKELATNQNFRAAVKNAYNPKFAGFSDSKWSKFAEKIGIKKKRNLSGKTDEERAKSLKDTTQNGVDETGKATTAASADDPVDPNCTEACDPIGQDAADQINNEANRIAAEADSGVKASTAALDEVTDAIKTPVSALSGLGNTFKVTGVADTACQAYGAVRTLGYAAKTVRAVQLARYAMVFLNTADMIKDGTAEASDVAYLGGILTSVAYDARAAATRSATDSFGYKYAAYGEVGTMNNFTAQFLAGGGLTGDLINVTSNILAAIPGGKETCVTLANPWVQAGSFAGGLALMIIPGGQAVMGPKIVMQGLAQVAFSVALMVLPGLLQDIVAGTVTDNLSSEGSGDAYTSGAGGLMSGLANTGGNGAMTIDDALAYNSLQTEVLASYIEDEVATLSPLDTSSRYTFLGSIVSSLIPSLSTTQGVVGNSISTFGSIISSSFSGLLPKTNALSTEQYKTSLEVCKDYDINDLGIASDPFCNVIYGIPPRYLDKDPLTVVDELGSQIDQTTGEPLGEYKTFVTNCIDRKEPLGADQGGSSGSECVINDSNANYYLHYVDQRVDLGMDGYDTKPPVVSEVPDVIPPSSTAGGSIDQSQLFADSTGIACASGTLDAGVAIGYHSGSPVSIRLCSIPNTTDGNNSNRPIRVNSRVSGAFLALTAAMAQGLGRTSLHVSDSFRTMAGQQAAFARYGSPRAARPGFSNHQMGLAIDFQLATGNNGATKAPGRDAVYDWLATNAGSYGIGKYSKEAWHWQPTGLN